MSKQAHALALYPLALRPRGAPGPPLPRLASRASSREPPRRHTPRGSDAAPAWPPTRRARTRLPPVADDAPSPEHDRFVPFFFFPQFLCYKTLKKCLKNIPEERAAKEDTPEGLTTAETNSGTRAKKELITLTAEQRAFVKTLND